MSHYVSSNLSLSLLIANFIGLGVAVDFESLNVARMTKRVEDVSEEMRELWVWYGLDLMVHVSRKELAWKQKGHRISKKFADCVTIGDEALALQIIALRGRSYVELKLKRREGEEV